MCYHDNNENKFIVCDPLYKMKQMRTFEEIDNFMNTSIGKWFISVNNKNRNNILKKVIL